MEGLDTWLRPGLRGAGDGTGKWAGHRQWWSKGGWVGVQPWKQHMQGPQDAGDYWLLRTGRMDTAPIKPPLSFLFGLLPVSPDQFIPLTHTQTTLLPLLIMSQTFLTSDSCVL